MTRTSALSAGCLTCTVELDVIHQVGAVECTILLWSAEYTSAKNN